MIIDRLDLKNFRNYDRLQVSFSEGINYIYGNNAQGKTNMLESLFFSGCAKSHRTNKDEYLVKEGEKGFIVKVHIRYGDDLGREIEIKYEKEGKKKELSVNGNKQKTISELFGNVNMVFFSPEDMMLIKKGPACRRRQIDISLSQLRPSYFFDLSRYYKIIMQKNNLLKVTKKREAADKTIEIWNDHQARYGAKVIKKRNEYIKEIAEIARTKHYLISAGKERLDIKYQSIADEKESEDSLYENLYRKYSENREREMSLGTTFMGPHRDDICFEINGMDARIYASQGQQRSSILSFKMAQLELIEKITGEKPILLLDDVFSELDEDRKKYICDSLDKIQTFITGTHKDDEIKEKFPGASYFMIEDGKVKET